MEFMDSDHYRPYVDHVFDISDTNGRVRIILKGSVTCAATMIPRTRSISTISLMLW